MILIRSVLRRKPPKIFEITRKIPKNYRHTIPNIDFLSSKDAVVVSPSLQSVSKKLTLVSEDTVKLSCLHIKSFDDQNNK